MKRSEYLATVIGQAHERFKRKLERFYFQFDAGVLKTKTSRVESEEIRFQTELINQMKKRKRRAYRNGVVAHIHFSVAQHTPPMIHSLPKYYIDLLENPHPAVKALCRSELKNEKKLLLNNDRQIKVLIVTYHVDDADPKTERSNLTITVDSLRNFEHDLRLLQRIKEDDFADRSKMRSFRKNFFEPEDINDDFHERVDELKDLIDRKADHLKIYGTEKDYERALKFSRQLAQEQYLKAGHVDLNGWLAIFGSVLYKDRPKEVIELMRRVEDGFRGLAFHQYFSIELPGTPTKKGQGDIFKAETKKALQDYYQKNFILNPLCHPISVSIALVPPKEGGKDLDNLALKIIPIVHEVLNPPTLEGAFSNPSEQAPYKGIHKNMVTRYQVVELPRHPTDPEGGSVRVMFENGLRVLEDLWNKADDVIDQWSDAAERI